MRKYLFFSIKLSIFAHRNHIVRIIIHEINKNAMAEKCIMRILLTFIVALGIVSCGNNTSRSTDMTDANDSIYTIEYINHICYLHPERALELLDTMEQRKLLGQNDINGLRAVIYQNGLDQSNVALKYAKRIYDSPDMLKDTVVAIKTYYIISLLSHQTGHYAEAMKYANEGSAYALSAGDNLKAATILLIAGYSIASLGHNAEAINYIDRAINVLKSLNNDKDYDTQRHILVGQMQKANIYMSTGQTDKAMALFDDIQKAYDNISKCDLVPEGHLEKYKGDINYMLITCYTEKNMMNEAARCYEEIMKLPKTHSIGKMVAPYLIATKQFDKALSLISESKHYMALTRDTVTDYYIENILLQEENIYKGMGRYKDALRVADNIKSITDSIMKREREHEAQEMATIYDMADKELQIANQETKLRNGRILVTVALALLLVAVVVIFIVVRYNRIIKMKNRAAVATIDELMATREKLQKKEEQIPNSLTDYRPAEKSNQETESNEETKGQQTKTEKGQTSETDYRTSETENRKPETEKQQTMTIDKLRREVEERKLFLDPLFDRNKAKETFPELNIRTLSAEFSQQYGISFPRYITSLRIDYALMLLCTDKDISVETIAAKSGFATRQTFYRSFTERFGISPSEYRRMKEAKM